MRDQRKVVSDLLASGAVVAAVNVRELLGAIVRDDYDSLRSAARTWRMSAAYLSDVLSGKREPGPKILRVLGIEKRVIVLYAAPPAPEATE